MYFANKGLSDGGIRFGDERSWTFSTPSSVSDTGGNSSATTGSTPVTSKPGGGGFFDFVDRGLDTIGRGIDLFGGRDGGQASQPAAPPPIYTAPPSAPVATPVRSDQATLTVSWQLLAGLALLGLGFIAFRSKG